MITDLAILQRAQRVVQRGGSPTPCEHGPFCLNCCLGLALIELVCAANVVEARALGALTPVLRRASVLARLRAPEGAALLTKEQALAALTLALGDAT
jgi:hypothetical protein